MNSPLPSDNESGDITRNMFAVCAGLTIAFIVQTMMLIAVPLYAIQLGASPLFIGIIVSAPYLLPLILAIPLGDIATQVGGKKIMIIGGLGMFLGPLTLLLFPGYEGLILSQCIVGLAHMILILGTQAIIASLGSGKVMERNFALYTTGVSAGQLAGPLLAGWIIDSASIQASFYVMCALAVAGMSSGFMLVGNARRGYKVSKELQGYRAQARLLKSNVAVQVSVVVSVGVIFALGAHASFLPIYLESLSLSATTIGALVSLRAFCSMAVRPFMPTTIELIGGRWAAIMLSMMLAAAGLLFTGFSPNIYLLALLACLIGIGGGISQPLSMVILVDHVKPAQRSSALGMRLMANRGIQFIAPLSLGFIAEFVSFEITFFIGGLFVILMLFWIRGLQSGFKQLEKQKRTDHS